MMREYAGMAETNIEELRARIAELEAALRTIANHEPSCDCRRFQFVPCLSCTAKAALGEGKWAEDVQALPYVKYLEAKNAKLLEILEGEILCIHCDRNTYYSGELPK